MGLAPITALHAQTTNGEAAADAETGRPRWEAGVAAAAGRVADYPGSNRSRTRAIAVPLVIYRGPVLRVDNGGIRGRVVDSPDWQLELSATGAFNARNNDARRGMPDLDYLFGVGPQLVYRGWRDAIGALTVHLKARAIFSTDLHRVQSRGYTVDPELRWRFRSVAGTPGSWTLSIEPTWASGALQRYFYEVDPTQATPTRPAYAARAGYLGTELGLTWSLRSSNTVSWFVGARAMSLHGAANDESPLLLRKTNLNVGAGLVWTPWQSTARAAD